MHIAKAKAGQVIGLILHDERGCKNHTNEKIDPERSNLNYNLCEGDALANYHRRMDQVYMRKNKNANTLILISNTLPKEVPEERKEEFFKYSHEFFCELFGKENIISDWVHGDETSWHQHLKFIPVYWNEKNQRETVSFDEVVPRSVYKKSHKALQKYLEDKMGIPVPILNGATAGGNKSIQELKADELKRENERLKQQNEELKKKNQQLQEQTEELKINILELNKEVELVNNKLDDLGEELVSFQVDLEDLKELKDTQEGVWLSNFLLTIQKRIQEGWERILNDGGIFISTTVLEGLERALQPFLGIKEHLNNIIDHFNSIVDDMNSMRSKVERIKQFKDPER